MSRTTTKSPSASPFLRRTRSARPAAAAGACAVNARGARGACVKKRAGEGRSGGVAPLLRLKDAFLCFVVVFLSFAGEEKSAPALRRMALRQARGGCVSRRGARAPWTASAAGATACCRDDVGQRRKTEEGGHVFDGSLTTPSRDGGWTRVRWPCKAQASKARRRQSAEQRRRKRRKGERRRKKKTRARKYLIAAAPLCPLSLALRRSALQYPQKMHRRRRRASPLPPRRRFYRRAARHGAAEEQSGRKGGGVFLDVPRVFP